MVENQVFEERLSMSVAVDSYVAAMIIADEQKVNANPEGAVRKAIQLAELKNGILDKKFSKNTEEEKQEEQTKQN